MTKPKIDGWSFDVDDIHWIEHSLAYRLGRLNKRISLVEKQSSVDAIKAEIKVIRELQGKIHNQKQFYRPKGVYVSG